MAVPPHQCRRPSHGAKLHRRPVGRRPGATWRRELASVAAAGFVVLFARSSLADHYVVPSGSMLPTVELGDRVVVDKAAFGWRVPLTQIWLAPGPDPEPGDVVVFEAPDSGEVLLKRVVGVPGDVVGVHAGRIVRNGAAAPVAADAGRQLEALGANRHEIWLGTGGPDFGPVEVPPGRYLLLGDNRAQSRDGRTFGWVPRRAILGRVVGIYRRQGAFVWIAL